MSETRERLLGILKRFPERRLLVIGDAIADQFVYGAINRVSREAPVFIIRHEQTETVPGGAANCAANIAALGGQVSLVSVVGADEAGQSLRTRLEAGGVDCSSLLTQSDAKTTTKVRILAGQSHSTRQQVIRIDYEGELGMSDDLRARILDEVRRHAGTTDAIVISDYNYGVAGRKLIAEIRSIANDARLPVLVDSRFSLLEFPRFTSATPNEAEVEQLLGEQIDSDEKLATAGDHLRSQLEYRALLVTRGGKGMMLFEEGSAPVALEAIGAHEPVDVTGAGDTVMAAYALALSSASSFSDAARLANHAGGLVVMKRGTASVSAQELEHSLLHSETA